MNDTPTPETDALYREMHEKGVAPPLKMFGVGDLCRRLERERDEWVGKSVELCAERESNAMQALAYKAERDELAESLRNIQASSWKTSGELRGMARDALNQSES